MAAPMERDDGISKTPGDSRVATKILEVHTHCSQVAGNETPIVIGGDRQDFRIESSVRTCTCGRPKVYRRLSSE
jgi:hypothetical protein